MDVYKSEIRFSSQCVALAFRKNCAPAPVVCQSVLHCRPAARTFTTAWNDGEDVFRIGKIIGIKWASRCVHAVCEAFAATQWLFCRRTSIVSHFNVFAILESLSVKSMFHFCNWNPSCFYGLARSYRKMWCNVVSHFWPCIKLIRTIDDWFEPNARQLDRLSRQFIPNCFCSPDCRAIVFQFSINSAIKINIFWSEPPHVAIDTGARQTHTRRMRLARSLWSHLKWSTIPVEMLRSLAYGYCSLDATSPIFGAPQMPHPLLCRAQFIHNYENGLFVSRSHTLCDCASGTQCENRR